MSGRLLDYFCASPKRLLRPVEPIALSILAGVLFFASVGRAYSGSGIGDGAHFPEPSITNSAPSGWSRSDAEQDPVSRQSQTRRRTAAAIGAGTIGLAAYGYSKWWRDGFVGSFRTVNESWFGLDTNSGGTDKLGHGYANYVGTRLLTWSFAALGHDRDAARKLGFVTTVAAFTAVEVIDGFSRKWRFSKEDALMNVAGAGLGYLVEKHPTLDQLLDFRLLYRAGKRDGKRDQWDPLGDYSGQTYLLTLKASGIASIRNQGPLRYLELAIGYRARLRAGQRLTR